MQLSAVAVQLATWRVVVLVGLSLVAVRAPVVESASVAQTLLTCIRQRALVCLRYVTQLWTPPQLVERRRKSPHCAASSREANGETKRESSKKVSGRRSAHPQASLSSSHASMPHHAVTEKA